VTTWTVVRFLHLLAIAFFVGGQLVLVAAITPVLQGRDEMREIARRFGIGSAAALVVIIATGIAMASHFDRWGDSTLHAKLGLLVLIFVLTGLHVVSNARRAISLSLVAVSVVIVYLGVRLSHG
jgi:putative copper export protein